MVYTFLNLRISLIPPLFSPWDKYWLQLQNHAYTFHGDFLPFWKNLQRRTLTYEFQPSAIPTTIRVKQCFFFSLSFVCYPGGHLIRRSVSLSLTNSLLRHQQGALILGFHQSLIKTTNRNHLMNKVKNLRYDRWVIYKQPRQEFGLCCFSFAHYLQKCVTKNL